MRRHTLSLRNMSFALPFLLQRSSATSAGCLALHHACPDITFEPGTTFYEYEKNNFWSNTQILSPACVLIPQSAEQVSVAVRAIKVVNGSFAARGGGHTAIAGANSIDDDVLIAFSNMTRLRLSDDLGYVHIGPGLKWGQVYNSLEPFGLTVAGGRVGPVGVPGLLLAGGIGFYGNKYGFSANTVTSYEVVLADGSIVNASASNDYHDLFWALKGGGPNFGLVTAFELRTIPSTRVLAGVLQFESSSLDRFLEAVAAYSADIYDPKSHIIPTVGFFANNSTGELSPYAYVVLFYDDSEETSPGIFKQFLEIPNVGNTVELQTVANLAAETGKSVIDAQSDILVGGTIASKDYSQLLAGVQLITRVFEESLQSIQSQVPLGTFASTEVYFQPLGHDFITASRQDGMGLGPLDLDEEQGTYIVYAIALTWVDSRYDRVVSSWIENTIEAIDSATADVGLYHPFRYMGDSTAFQIHDFYNRYPHGALGQLNSVARKYDIDGFFQKNMPGGFKLAASVQDATSTIGEGQAIEFSQNYDAGLFQTSDRSVSEVPIMDGVL